MRFDLDHSALGVKSNKIFLLRRPVTNFLGILVVTENTVVFYRIAYVLVSMISSALLRWARGACRPN
jgi:hypothetical protein